MRMEPKDMALICGVLGLVMGFALGLFGVILAVVVGLVMVVVYKDDEDNAGLGAMASSLVGGIVGWMLYAVLLAAAWSI